MEGANEKAGRCSRGQHCGRRPASYWVFTATRYEASACGAAIKSLVPAVSVTQTIGISGELIKWRFAISLFRFLNNQPVHDALE
jgi:hypothetical protein